MKRSSFFSILLLFIITIPSFFSLLNNQYFSMHDDQHIVRLYLLDTGIKQNSFYPRWVDGLGFGFGYPLFNFYPPLVYYLAEVFHLLGFSFIWSIKLTFILGFILSTVGIYLLIKELIGKLPAFLTATLYTYFFYHAVDIYVRGALAEFISYAILPFVFLSLIKLSKEIDFKNTIFFGVSFAVIILTHPLIAFPSLFFIGFFLIFFLINLKNKRWLFLKYFILGSIIAVSLSAFFCFLSIDDILTKELANYKIHYIYPQQFLYSPWGYGGSTADMFDGMSFQLGKIHIFLTLLAIILSLVFFFKNKINKEKIKYFYFFVFLLFFSLFMTTRLSSFLWDTIKYLWYLQFPWRFLTFSGLFIAAVGSFSIYFFQKLISLIFKNLNSKMIGYLSVLLVVIISFTIIFVYKKYFKPQRLLSVTDRDLTSYEEIAWRISKTSFEFVPKGVKTKKTPLNTTILDINKDQLPTKLYQIISGKAEVVVDKNKFNEKELTIKATTPIIFQLNVYYFPGWRSFLDGKKISINDNNEFKLQTLLVPKGKHKLIFRFEDTPIRRLGNLISLGSFFLIVLTLFRKRKVSIQIDK